MKAHNGHAVGMRQAGLTIVELLVAMAVGLFIMSGVVVVVSNSQNQFFQQEDVSYIQENARFAMDQVAYDIRMAGYYGCNVQGTITNTVASTSDPFFDSTGIRGFEYGDSNIPTSVTGMAAGTDMVIVSRADPVAGIQVSGHNPSSARIDLSASIGREQGDILMIASPNCSHTAVFQMTGPANTTNPTHLNHNTGGGGGGGGGGNGNNVSPGNCHKNLSAGYVCDGPGEPAANDSGSSYPNGSSIMDFVSHGYFIRQSDTTGLPSLYRMALSNAGGTAAPVAEEVASGVEDMELIYGLDDDADGIVDRYYSANDIALADWAQVLSVRVTLIMRSSRELFDENTVVDLGEGFTYNDRYMRQKVSTTIRIRNRGLGVST